MQTSQMNIAIVVSTFNSEITEKLLQGALSTLISAGVNENNIKVVKVPGAIEIPLTAKLLAKAGYYHAIICLGAVICGETNHYEYVCQQVSQGCQQVMLEYTVPVIFGVLTTHNEQQAEDRVCITKEHKGVESAEAAIHMVKVMEELALAL